jgi:hypothetical protein
LTLFGKTPETGSRLSTPFTPFGTDAHGSTPIFQMDFKTSDSFPELAIGGPSADALFTESVTEQDAPIDEFDDGGFFGVPSQDDITAYEGTTSIRGAHHKGQVEEIEDDKAFASPILEHDSHTEPTVDDEHMSMPAAMQEQYIQWMVDGAFFEALYPQETKTYDVIKSLAARRIPLKKLRRAVDEIENRLRTVDYRAWQRTLAFKNMLAQLVFYYQVMHNPALTKIFVDVDVWSFHMVAPSFPIYVTGIALMKKIVDDVNWMMRLGVKNPQLKIMADYVLRERSDITQAVASTESKGMFFNY